MKKSYSRFFHHNNTMGKKDKEMNNSEEVKKDEAKKDIPENELDNKNKTEQKEKDNQTDKKPEADNSKELAEIEALNKQLNELSDKYIRLIAEYDNYRKRTEKEKTARYNDAYADALLLVLPIIDNVERAVEYANDDSELSKGIKILQKQCEEVILKSGIEEIKALGEQFNPELHNAIAHSEEEDKETNTITQVFVKGYKKDDKIIRYALVKVAN